MKKKKTEKLFASLSTQLKKQPKNYSLRTYVILKLIS